MTASHLTCSVYIRCQDRGFWCSVHSTWVMVALTDLATSCCFLEGPFNSTKSSALVFVNLPKVLGQCQQFPEGKVLQAFHRGHVLLMQPEEGILWQVSLAAHHNWLVQHQWWLRQPHHCVGEMRWWFTALRKTIIAVCFLASPIIWNRPQLSDQYRSCNVSI